MANNWEILHTEEIKKKYSRVEKEIKRNLTEVLLMNGFGARENISRWLSITKDFQIRELSAEENSKFLSNPSTIKSPILSYTTESIKLSLFDLVDSEVADKDIAQKYKNGISDFFNYMERKNVKRFLKEGNNSELFRGYLSQSKELSNVKKRNVKLQVAKILFEKFGDDAFSKKPNKKKDRGPFIVFSDKSLDYIRTIFNIANSVRESWWKRIDQVFHDGDYPFITNNIKATESDYIDVITYLLDRWKIAYYGKRWLTWQRQWSKKTSQYADILWALTDNQLRIHEYPDLSDESVNFKRDSVTNNLSIIWWWLLDDIVTAHNEDNPSKKLQLSKRLKSASSCAEKIIEWKKINDTIWLRLSMRWISDQNFDDIKKISKYWFKIFKASLNKNPNKYVSPWQTISIKEISIDNKWVLESEQLEDIAMDLNKIIPTKIRKKLSSPYIGKEKRIERMENFYPEIVNDSKKRETVQAFYERITGWKARWRNWSYKDFKFNITFEIKDEKWNSIWERNMEVQFDDINNGKWLSNYNIRNFERWVNTQSRLSFSVPLCDARKKCEKHLKAMRLWAKRWTSEWITKEEQKQFFEIPFTDGTSINISGFARRNPKNSKIMDEAIVKIINYFLQKGTFILYYNPEVQEKEETIQIDRLLTVDDLHNPQIMKNLHICSSLELASQQHSYLQGDWERKVWIYLGDQNDIWWISVGELIDPMNLWKKKDENYSVWL